VFVTINILRFDKNYENTAAFANTTDCVFFNMTPLIYGNNIEKALRRGLKQVSDGEQGMDILG
jgi:hypothetical protein